MNVLLDAHALIWYYVDDTRLSMHAAKLISLPYHHRDPFDRLLISQALVENMPIISVDSAFGAYPINRLW